MLFHLSCRLLLPSAPLRSTAISKPYAASGSNLVLNNSVTGIASSRK